MSLGHNIKCEVVCDHSCGTTGQIDLSAKWVDIALKMNENKNSGFFCFRPDLQVKLKWIAMGHNRKAIEMKGSGPKMHKEKGAKRKESEPALAFISLLNEP